MNDIPTEPESCSSMAEVRAGVDAVDRQLSVLLGVRMRFMDAAARIKPDRSMVRDEPRKAQVIAHAKNNASANGVPPALAEAIWETLVEASIAYELEAYDKRR